MFAVYDGRFQPFHVGHMAFIERIHAEIKLPVAIMVIQSSVSGISEGYSATADEHHQPAKNPLSVWERITLIRRAVDYAKFDFVAGVLAIPRPDLYWNLARSFYPDQRVICLSGKDEYERQKEVFWAERGEKTVVINIDGLPKISATELKRKMQQDDDWSDLIPPGALEYFQEIGALYRMQLAA